MILKIFTGIISDKDVSRQKSVNFDEQRQRRTKSHSNREQFNEEQLDAFKDEFLRQGKIGA